METLKDLQDSVDLFFNTTFADWMDGNPSHKEKADVAHSLSEMLGALCDAVENLTQS